MTRTLPRPGLGPLGATPAVSGVIAGSDATAVARPTIVALVLCVMFQKVALPIGGGFGLEIPLFVMFGLVGVLMIRKRAYIDINRLIFYAGMIALCAVSQVIGSVLSHTSFSIQSLLLLALIYSIYIFQVDVSREEHLNILRAFQYIALAIAGLVFLGWITQAIGLGMLNMEKLIPSGMLYRTFVYIQPVHWGSPFIKPNGFFMLETSHTSQILSMALIMELCLFKRGTMALVFFVGLMSTFGGTGMLMLALASPIILFQLTRFQILVILVSLPLAFLGAKQIGLLDNINDRTESFSKDGSSANGRFIAPAEQIRDSLTHDFTEAMFGVGAGNSKVVGEGNFRLALPKMLGEYGFMASLTWLAFTIFVVFGRGVPTVTSWITFLQLQLLNAALLLPIHNAYCLLLAALFAIRPDAPLAAKPSRTDTRPMARR